ncbi:MAG: 2Fe-2S iron-sulfur cluster-binding protein, partial [Candidatus Poribacteria bacterium]
MRALTVLPDGTEVESVEDNDVLASLHHHGTILTSPCGGEGTCGKCRIQAEDGAVNAPTPQERSLLGAALDDGWRLACQTTLQADVTVRIPPSSRVPNVRVLTGGVSRDVPFFPNVRRRTFTWERAALGDAESIVDAVADLLDARADLRIELDVVRALADGLEDGTTYEATIIGNRLVSISPEAADADPLGVALDVGTTTVVAQVVNLKTGEAVGTDSRVNDQSRFGGDVIARINHSITEDHGLHELQDSVLSTIKECIAASGVDPSQVYEAVAVGNTTMMHLLAGISPE